MEMPKFDPVEFARWKQAQKIIKETDMKEEILTEAAEFVSDGIEQFSGVNGIDMLAAAKMTKEKMDNKFGPTWHCIIGQGFSFDVTTMSNTKLYMYYAGKVGVLLFKC
eukprot:NODE_8521_length_406_cov_29.529412_g7645_i0.p1 GENE.NODE_8521_length_406_cov_29.529412_g7645_i0~~NODE_8521_length_406_cov_29.529412_g7645_i0.p1  ORF type:complete len:108 (+),score=27.20 NODE_8521_length_406_cov_29.529412_g7645_i0:51-374(+)